MRRALGIAVLVLAAAAIVVLFIGHRGSKSNGTASQLASATTTAKSGARITRTGATLLSSGADGTADTMTGVEAFRAFSDDFIEANPDAVKEHMEREGLTRAETKELTYFALLVSESHDWDSVEALTGHPMEPEARRQAWSQMQHRSRQMRDELQAQVKNKAAESDRWATIDRIESSYLADYYLLTGMTPALLDQLLRVSVESQSATETAAALAPNAPVQVPSGANSHCVRRDPSDPKAAPVAVPCPQ